MLKSDKEVEEKKEENPIVGVPAVSDLSEDISDQDDIAY